MKKVFAHLVFTLLTGILSVQGGQSATVNLHCLSLRIPQGSASMLGLSYTLQLTTGSGQNPDINNELMPDWSSSSSAQYISRFVLQSDAYPEPIPGIIGLYIPPFVDNNSNNISDFFEVSQPITPIQTSGIFVDDWVGDEGRITAIWSRDAGQRIGSCSLKMVGSFVNLTFPMTFEIMEYDGTMDYTMESSSPRGAVTLSLALSSTETLGGPIGFQVLGTNDLTLLGGVWTNSSGQTFTYLATTPGESIERYETNYYGYFEFKDGDPLSGMPGYNTWMIAISDKNDSNKNGIPNLSDLPPPVPPRLMLSLTNRSLKLLIEAEAGRSCQIEKSVSITSTNWIPALLITMTNAYQILELPLPNEPTCFWRAYLLKY